MLPGLIKAGGGIVRISMVTGGGNGDALYNGASMTRRMSR
jgi:hypothetical protein